MTAYVALLRAVNVGGTGTLPMATLRALCAEAGFTNVRTYIASGNVLFDGANPQAVIPEAAIKATLEERLAAHAGKPVGVLVRTAAEMAAVLAEAPFPQAPPERVAVIFLDSPPPADAAAAATGRNGEEIRVVGREIHVHYVNGMGRSTLRIPAAAAGTARNMNTVAKLVELAARS